MRKAQFGFSCYAGQVLYKSNNHFTHLLMKIESKRLVKFVAAALAPFILFTNGIHLFAATEFIGCGGEVVAAANSGFEGNVAELVNQRRAENGLPPLKLIPELSNASRYHAADMHQDNYFSHPTQDRINGGLRQVCGWSDRVGVYYANYSRLAENIAAGYTSPADVMNGWMNSPGHRANILGNYRELGVGYFNDYWVQNFSTRDDNYPLIINREATQTASREVTIYVYGSWEQMRLRNDGGAWAEWQPFQNEFTWTLSDADGLRAVDVEVRSGATVATSGDVIELQRAAPPAPTPEPPPLPERVYIPLMRR